MRYVTSWKSFQITVIVCLYFFYPLCSVLAQKPVNVLVAKAKIGTMADRVEALGTLRANESVSISAAVTDTITRINFDDNQRVRTGDILVEMTSSEEHALLEEEKSTLAEARKQLMRIEKLLKTNAAPQTLLDQRRRDFETAQARMRQIESKLQDHLILAPFSGVVGLRNISVGALVEPGDPITTLDDDSVMKLDFSVPATFLDTLTPGLPIKARAASFKDRTFSGTISSIDSRVDINTRSITARALLENSDRALKPGMLMYIELLKNPRDSIIIPEEALIPIGNTTFVYRVVTSENVSKAEKQVVITGGRRVGEVEIISGLTPDDLVVVQGGLRLRPGAAVVVQAIDDGTKSLEQMLQKSTGKE